jgi:hypothetical protein|tara:strand:+ start:346 stop:519 length:174 start_codon:yes stop_codon:yes gene_type:complete
MCLVEFVKYLLHFYFVALYFALANGLIVGMKVIAKLCNADTILYDVDYADVLWCKAC